MGGASGAICVGVGKLCGKTGEDRNVKYGPASRCTGGARAGGGGKQDASGWEVGWEVG